MSLELQPVDLVHDRAEATALLQRNLPDLDHARRFEWLYLRNPAGPAWSWFVRSTGGPHAVGMASLVPRWLWVGNEAHRCGQVADFAIDAGHRSLGPALLLQRATFGPVDDGRLRLCYDCPPHDRGMAPFRRLGLSPHTRMLRYARLLGAERLVHRYVRPGAAATALARIGTAALQAARWGRPRERGVEVQLHADRFGDEFSTLDVEVGGAGIIRARRGHPELNWRYRDDPLHDYVVLTARRGGVLAGFAVLLASGADAFLVDLFGRLTSGVAVELIEAAAEVLRARRIGIVYALASEHGDVAPMLRRGGFHHRGTAAAVVAYARRGSEVQAALDSHRWSLTHAEIQA